ncbi:hypothetical protein Pmani_034068 [Petrolisthes manimaculis]|uniref:Uncharacterized protein n=1 Tax=Petrolisthes manimaculis TaxID=1843537 RepID=A0AAE1NPW4_9EUCA|nr:hypothetical protein Pmani_034068 [Petrolisthes manimaculis]
MKSWQCPEGYETVPRIQVSNCSLRNNNNNFQHQKHTSQHNHRPIITTNTYKTDPALRTHDTHHKTKQKAVTPRHNTTQHTNPLHQKQHNPQHQKQHNTTFPNTTQHNPQLQKQQHNSPLP